MVSRPHFNKSALEIDELYKRSLDNVSILQELLAELHHIETPRAFELRAEIAAAINKCIGLSNTLSQPSPTTQPPAHHESTPLSKAQSQIVNVIEYLSSIAKINSAVVREIENYQSVLWFSDIPHDGTNCYARSWGAEENISDDIWLEVIKKPEPLLPAIPKNCEQWIKLSQLRILDTPPELPQSITLTSKVIDPSTGEQHEKIETILLLDNPFVSTSWNDYVRQKWQPWLIVYKKYLEVQKVFGALFSIFQEQQRLGEQYELVVGVGLLTWRQPMGQKVRRHLLVARASLEFESAIGRFVVKAAPDGDQAELELDMLDPASFPANASSLVAAGRQLRDNFWERTTGNSILSSVSNSLEGQGRGVYNADSDRPTGANASEIPLIEFAPALILRKRSQKGLLNILADILRQVESGVEIPGQFLDLCEVNDLDDIQDEPEEHGAAEPDHIYFPLPANEQQRQIIRLFNRQRGVLVQGPPGTGKSQTISNLICHLLATGQRVLVTAKTARALEVLHEKIPQAVSPLCISMLGSGTDERESLERSVNGIQVSINRRDDIASARKIEELEQKLHENKKAIAEAEYALVTLSENETFQHSVAGGAYTGTAASIATKLLADKQTYSWLMDEIKASDETPLSQTEINELATLLTDITKETEAELSMYIPDTVKDIPDCGDLCGLWQDLSKYEHELNGSAERLNSLSGQAITKVSRDQITVLGRTMKFLMGEIQSVKNRPLAWIDIAVKEVLSDLDTPWKQLHRLTTERLAKLKSLAEITQSYVVEIPPNIDLMRLSGDAKSLNEHFSSGGGVKKYLFFEHPLVKRHGETVKQARLDGQDCLEQSRLKKLIEFLAVKFLLAEIWSLWAGKKASSHPDQHPLMQIAEIEELIEALEHALGLYETRKTVINAVSAIPGLPRPQFENMDSLIELFKTCKNVLDQSAMKQVKLKLLVEEARISAVTARNNAHPICSELSHAFIERDPDRYYRVVSTLHDIGTQCARFVTKQGLLNRIASKAPLFAETITNAQDIHIAVLRLNMLDKAWAWRQASDWINIFQHQDGNVLERNIRRLEISSSKSLEELAALKAWSHCFSRMTSEQQANLESWRQSMRRLPKSGRHLQRRRRNVQESHNRCKDAVPAWIMPLHRVYETVAASPGCFDVIIVDEASQCGFEALPLLYLAKKIIVVGDEQQISPEAVGIDLDHIFNLMDMHLSGLNHRASFDIDNSLFAHCQIRFGNRITLREHFRCAPEIIRFSNDLCYTANPLIPLKQVAPNRLEPLKAVHVLSGYREGSNQTVVNRPEAEAIVRQIMECCGDSSYDGMTMGVITLQGDTQGKIIEDMLVRQLGTEEMQDRRILCGNPYSFQGDERDVIFLSMVAATNERAGALVDAKAMRRFNVAASRAREQMWLFHSVTSNDLSNSCLRKRLLNHFYNTAVTTVAGISVDDLQRAAYVADRWQEKAPDPFDSWFEVDVALQIAGHGYTVIPQFEFAGKKIDLVIQGGCAQLAVECDGDHWHGRDQFEADMQRQRMLERCNWVFFRVRECNYRVDKEKALESLWGMLEARGIFPQGNEQSAGTTDEPIDEPIIEDEEEQDQNDFEDSDFVADEDAAVDNSDNTVTGCPLSIQSALNFKPSELRALILETMKTLPNYSCVRDALATIILKKCHIRTSGIPRNAFERKVVSQVAAMVRDGHLVAYKSKNERLKLGWSDSEY